MAYNWDLMERLLHEVQNCAGKPFIPHAYAEALGKELQQRGEQSDSINALQAEATRYASELVKGGFIETRPEREGGNGENFVLTPRGLQLLSMIDSSIPGDEHPREVLDEAGNAALTAEVFDGLAPRANLT